MRLQSSGAHCFIRGRSCYSSVSALCRKTSSRNKIFLSVPGISARCDIEELASELVGVAGYFQISSHFDENALYQAQNQYKIKARGARDRERRDSQHLPNGRPFDVDSV